MAAYWRVPPIVSVAPAGVTAIETSCAPVTAKVVDEETEPEAAVMVAVPTPELAARPFEPAVLLITAMLALEELQVTTLVRSCVLLSV
jgi:hypothetical protein